MAVRVLVVDDATFIRDMVKRQLREKIPGIEIFDAVDGHRAVALLKKQRVDLVLSDWEMPGMSGEELLRWIRTHEDYATLPFVMVTSRGDRSHVIKAVEAGVSDYLTKPFTPEELLTKTIKQLRKAGINLNAPTKQTGSTQGVAFSSVDVLTGGSKPVEKPKQPAVQAAGGAFAAKPAAASAAAKPAQPAKTRTKGRAQLRFANTSCACVVKDISLQAMNGLIQRAENLPTVFDQAVVDIETDDGESVARVNGYVHSIQAAESRVDTNVIKIIIRFVDNDPEKFEILSKYIATS
jgi:CheY-like chemotaxis protein